ncbi:hypothetical protein ACPPVO_22800 [Dactylosporangium sp. McL0621]|uniref:hypothetical protein n=1 Tax=Dactylosporangium sp. McL0621 TaxID=3415678 RepID=UPI003CF2B957
MAVTVVYFGLLVADVAALVAADAILADPASIFSAASRAVFDRAALLGTVTQVWIWVYLAGFVAWSAGNRRSLQQSGRAGILEHWTYTIWRIALGLVVVLALVLASRHLPGTDDPTAFRDAFISRSYALMGYTALRIVMLALLSAYAIVVWRRVTRTPDASHVTDQPNARRHGPAAAVVAAGLAGITIVTIVVSDPGRSATVPRAAGTASATRAAATPGPGILQPTGTLAAPDAIIEYRKAADQTPATTMLTTHPFPGVEHPFDAYYRDPAGHTATIWGGTGKAFDRDFDIEGLDALLNSLGPLGGMTADHFRTCEDLARTIRCSQFNSQSQRGTTCIWAGHGAILAFVFTDLDAPGASDILWPMVHAVILL